MDQQNGFKDTTEGVYVHFQILIFVLLSCLFSVLKSAQVVFLFLFDELLLNE